MRKILVVLFLSIFYSHLYSQITISQVRDTTIGAVVTVTGIVTNGPELGTIRYIQDSTGGIGIYPGGNSVPFTPERGDEVTVTGTISEYASLLEIDDLTSVTINSSGNELPTPVLLTPNQIAEEYEGQLVTIVEAEFDNPGGSFSGNTNYNLTSNGQVFTIRINTSSNLVGQVIPAIADITAIVSQYSWEITTEGYQLLPRDTNDIESLSILSITSLPVQSNITQSGFTLSWTTNDTSLTRLDYGMLEDLPVVGTIEGNDYVTEHTVQLTGLIPGTVYYARAYSILGDDTASTAIRAYATESNSSGEIKVYFTQAVDTSVSNGTYAVAAVNTIEDTIISYINKAVNKLDIVIYDVESEPIVNAINDAYNRGVEVRYITDSVPDTETNPVLNNLDPGIPLLKGNTAAIMHDKFIIIDHEDENNCWLMTGSTNHTDENLGWDKNNMVCIQDQSVARAYLVEFNEMWGSPGMVPNPDNAKFGSAKSDNTPHQFIVNSKPLEIYFSPSDHTTSAIVDVLETTNNELEFGVMVFTENSLGAAVNSVHDNGAAVRGIIDYVEYSGSEFDYLLSNGIDVLDYQNPDGTSWPDGPVFHHKYAIIDYNTPDSDPIVVTGSHNWSGSAESSNDENTLIIHDATIANLFHQEFTQRYNDLLTPVLVNDTSITLMNRTDTIDVLQNDFVHYQVDSIVVDIIEQPANGLVVTDNQFLYFMPQAGFYGFDTLKYVVKNGSFPVLADTAFCFVEVEQISVLAVNDSVQTVMNEAVRFDPLENDSWDYNDNLVLNVIDVTNGVAEISDDQLIEFTPESMYYGIAMLNYSLCYSSIPEICDTANAIITVSPIYPIAHNDIDSVNMNETLDVNVLQNDENPGGFDLKLIAENPAHGVVSVTDSIIIYTPETDFLGTDTITYIVSEINDDVLADTAKLIVKVLYVERASDIETANNLTVYPNPAKNNLTLELNNRVPQVCDIELIELAGKVVFSTQKSLNIGVNKVPLTINKQGVYILVVKTKSVTYYQKILMK